MAELEIDQSNLPRVQEVCQNFAVLEDSVLAHSLQEQEIEHYYTTNIQKNQLVQNDIRMAKRLQDEEDERRKQQSSLLRQASRQIEEQDCEYARVIQEELQLCADEAHRREREDEEIAKQIQEEEEWRGRSSSRARESFSDDDAGGPSSPSSHQHTLSSMQRGERPHQPSAATRGHCSSSHTQSDLSEPEAPRGPVARKHTTPLSNEGHRVCVRRISDQSLECSSEDSETSDSVFYERSRIGSRGSFKRADTAPCRRRVSLSEPRQKHYRSLHSHCSFREERSVRKEERGEWNEHPEYDPPEDKRGRDHGEERDDRRRNGERWRGPRPEEAGGQRRRCSESVRLHDRDRRRDGDLARTWSSREIPDKHVHFRDQRQGYHDDGNIGIWEMLGRVLRERGIAVRHGAPPPPVPPQGPHGVQSRPSQPLHLHRSEASYRDSQPPLRGFQRSALARHSYHGNARQPRSPAHKATSEVCEEPGGESGGGSRRWQRGELKPEARSSGGDYEREDGGHSRCECRVSRSRSESWHWRKREEEELSLEEQEEQQQQQQEEEEEQESRRRRVLRRSQSLRGRRVSGRVLSRDVSTGSTLSPQPRGAGLDLAELQQVLQDEELARRLQEEEDRRVRRPIEESSRPPHPRRSSPQAGDFRVAQVAQDEEIARFMQKQEIKSKRRSRELEGPSSWREHREMISHHDRRAARERQGQRERLDSEGLPSPTEDYSPENEPPSPISTITQAQQIRNIAEELDPTFKARRRDKSGLRTGQSGPACPSLSVPQPSAQDPLEEPAFIPPTKRQGDKPGRTKPKEKKENCKQQ